MGRKQYNSAADRRWQQRYQRIQERKEANWEYDQAKRERRKEIKDYYISQGFQPEKLLRGKVAVLCKSYSQLRQVFNETFKRMPQYVRHWDRMNLNEIWECYKPEVVAGIINMRNWPFDDDEVFLYSNTENYFRNKRYEIVEFFDCIPVRDLGAICVECESIDSLLEI